MVYYFFICFFLIFCVESAYQFFHLQVPADGVLISGHSLAIDESSMTGESKTVHKDQKAPFLMSGCKVADGYGSMLVTGVGINTEWGQLMANLSEDNGEETPLQVIVFNDNPYS